MLTAAEKKTLKRLLAMSENPHDTFSYDELLGYLFGLAMTPDIIVPSEWMPVIFGGYLPEFPTMERMQTMTGSLIQTYNRFITDFHADRLNFPFDIEKLREDQFEALYEWVSGFEEAIALREDIWDPEEYPDLPERKKEELYHSMMTIQGLVDPLEVMDYFEDLPDELFQEAFSGIDPEQEDRQLQIQVFLMASLPLAIKTFQEHARTVEKKRQRQFTRSGSLTPLRSVKFGRNDPCPCNSGKKYKKCCGANAAEKAAPADNTPSKGSNVIKVDFPQHGHKRATVQNTIYQLKVELQGARPPIWRRIQVPGSISLERLHKVIQTCMGWTDSHLHQFLIDRTCYCLPDEDDLWRTSRPKNEAKYTLQDLDRKIQPRFQYIYDFGDDWIHQITVEKTFPPESDETAPVLLTGRRTCPPEDVGGIHGYMHLLEVLDNPDHEEFQALTDWLGNDSFDPARFGKEEIVVINVRLEKLFKKAKK